MDTRLEEKTEAETNDHLALTIFSPSYYQALRIGIDFDGLLNDEATITAGQANLLTLLEKTEKETEDQSIKEEIQRILGGIVTTEKLEKMTAEEIRSLLNDFDLGKYYEIFMLNLPTIIKNEVFLIDGPLSYDLDLLLARLVRSGFKEQIRAYISEIARISIQSNPKLFATLKKIIAEGNFRSARLYDASSRQDFKTETLNHWVEILPDIYVFRNFGIHLYPEYAKELNIDLDPFLLSDFFNPNEPYNVENPKLLALAQIQEEIFKVDNLPYSENKLLNQFGSKKYMLMAHACKAARDEYLSAGNEQFRVLNLLLDDRIDILDDIKKGMQHNQLIKEIPYHVSCMLIHVHPKTKSIAKFFAFQGEGNINFDYPQSIVNAFNRIENKNISLVPYHPPAETQSLQTFENITASLFNTSFPEYILVTGWSQFPEINMVKEATTRVANWLYQFPHDQNNNESKAHFSIVEDNDKKTHYLFCHDNPSYLSALHTTLSYEGFQSELLTKGKIKTPLEEFQNGILIAETERFLSALGISQIKMNFLLSQLKVNINKLSDIYTEPEIKEIEDDNKVDKIKALPATEDVYQANSPEKIKKAKATLVEPPVQTYPIISLEDQAKENLYFDSGVTRTAAVRLSTTMPGFNYGKNLTERKIALLYVEENGEDVLVFSCDNQQFTISFYWSLKQSGYSTVQYHTGTVVTNIEAIGLLEDAITIHSAEDQENLLKLCAMSDGNLSCLKMRMKKFQKPFNEVLPPRLDDILAPPVQSPGLQVKLSLLAADPKVDLINNAIRALEKFINTDKSTLSAEVADFIPLATSYLTVLKHFKVNDIDQALFMLHALYNTDKKLLDKLALGDNGPMIAKNLSKAYGVEKDVIESNSVGLATLINTTYPANLIFILETSMKKNFLNHQPGQKAAPGHN